MADPLLQSVAKATSGEDEEQDVGSRLSEADLARITSNRGLIALLRIPRRSGAQPVE